MSLMELKKKKTFQESYVLDFNDFVTHSAIQDCYLLVLHIFHRGHVEKEQKLFLG